MKEICRVCKHELDQVYASGYGDICVFCRDGVRPMVKVKDGKACIVLEPIAPVKVKRK